MGQTLETEHPFWSYQRSSVIVLFFFLLDCRFLKRVSEEMGKMLKEVTCSCFRGEGVRVVRLRESERSKLHECMQTSLFLLTSFAVPDTVLKNHCESLNSSFTIVHVKGGEKATMANIFPFIY